jgi:hypothetical protein
MVYGREAMAVGEVAAPSAQPRVPQVLVESGSGLASDRLRACSLMPARIACVLHNECARDRVMVFCEAWIPIDPDPSTADELRPLSRESSEHDLDRIMARRPRACVS